MGYLTLSDGREQTIDSNADGRISPDDTTDARTDESSNASDRGDYDRLPGLIDEYAEEDMGQEIYKRDHIDSGVQLRAWWAD